MSKVIWKYPIKPVGETELEIPFNSVVLSAGVIGGACYIWVLLDPEETFIISKYVNSVETGQSFDSEEWDRFVGTLMLDNGLYIIHVLCRSVD